MSLSSLLNAKLIKPQLWDVCSDQEAVDLVRNQLDPNVAAKQLVDHALARFSTDNLSCMIVRFDKSGLINSTKDSIGVEGDAPANPTKISEVDKIVAHAKWKAQADGVPGLGVSGSNSGKGHDPLFASESDLVLRNEMEMENVVEEEADVEEEDDDEEEKDAEEDVNGAKITVLPEAAEPSLPAEILKPAT